MLFLLYINDLANCLNVASAKIFAHARHNKRLYWELYLAPTNFNSDLIQESYPFLWANTKIKFMVHCNWFSAKKKKNKLKEIMRYDVSSSFWTCFSNWWHEKFNHKLTLSESTILYGCHKESNNWEVLNYCLIVAKYKENFWMSRDSLYNLAEELRNLSRMFLSFDVNITLVISSFLCGYSFSISEDSSWDDG